MTEMTMQDYAALVGTEIGVSRWFMLDQKRIDSFADVTEDWQYIHIDPAKAAATPFGGTIAHGFLTLSMLAAMAYDGLPTITGRVMGVNYGFDKIRFMAPVRAGRQVRARFKLLAVVERNPREFQTRSEVTVEIEGEAKPAIVAEWLGLAYFAQAMTL
jgi:acyl dehydratase